MPPTSITVYSPIILMTVGSSAVSRIATTKSPPAATIETLSQAVKKLLGASNPVQVIGTRHGEKLYETLLTREELAVAEDMGDYYRVPADKRDLNYELYFDKGEGALSTKEDYNSHNTRRLNLDELAAMLESLDIVKRARAGEKINE